MKLLTAAQTRKWDEYTIHHEPISSLDLMERAAAKCTDWLIRNNFTKPSIKIFCGKGNNGGDGLAIARQLIEKNIQPSVYILENDAGGSGDFEANLQRLQVTTQVHFIRSKADLPGISCDNVVVDALFGSGLNRAIEGLAADVTAHLNNSQAIILSIDVPSGMFIDRSSQGNTIIKADHTLTFQSLKLCFLIAENSRYFGSVEVLDIGLDKSFLSQVTPGRYITDLEDIAALYRPRNKFSHKGDAGHALIIGGAGGKTGAAIIATELCLRSGAGLTSVHLLSGDHTAINTRCPEAMTLAGDELVKKNLSHFSAIGIGPGLGTDDIAIHIVSLLLDSYNGPLILDADALNVLSKNQHMLTQLTTNTIITPHPKEFDRLFGKHENGFDRINTALQNSKERGCIVVLKGHYTLVAVNGEAFFNNTGNAGLAKGGSGDALTGIITSLLAQGYPPASAAGMGVFIHGLAADLALEDQSQETLLATDLSNYIAPAFKMLSNAGK